MPILKAWIARDFDGDAHLFDDKPFKPKNSHFWIGRHLDTKIPDRWLQQLNINPQWNDNEPIQVEIKIDIINHTYQQENNIIIDNPNKWYDNKCLNCNKQNHCVLTPKSCNL